MQTFFRSGVRLTACALAVALLAGCESLPSVGPSARAVGAAGLDPAFPVVDLDYRVSQVLAAHPPRVLTSLSAASSVAPIDLIGEGDVLAVWVYQADGGPALGQRGAQSGRADDLPGLAPNLTVEQTGTITVPFAGPVQVAGLTPQQAAEAIRRALAGTVMNPQVVVNVVSNVANSVTLVGEVRNAGRFPLSVNGDRLLDILALGGGAAGRAADVEVTVVRGSRSGATSLARVLNDPAENIRLAPRDQIRVTLKPRKFSTFGALARSSQMAIEDDTLSLAGALSRMGGLDPSRADAAAVLVFRFERLEVAEALGLTIPPAAAGVPVTYRLNLREPSGYFVANTFEVRSDDLIYVPQTGSAELRSFFDLVTSITRVAYDVTLVGAL